MAQNRWEKKLPNLPKNCENPRFFEFHKVIKWCGRNWPIIIPKYWLFPKVLPKFCLCPKPKNSWKYPKKLFPKKRPFFFGVCVGGVNLLNVVFTRFDAACIQSIYLFYLNKENRSNSETNSPFFKAFWSPSNNLLSYLMKKIKKRLL